MAMAPESTPPGPDGAEQSAPRGGALGAPPQTPKPEAPKPEAAPAVGADSGAVMLRDRYAIQSGNRLKSLDSPTCLAYTVSDRRDPTRALYALVAPPGLPVRSWAAGVLRSSPVPNMVPLIEFGAVDWEPLGRKAMVFVYQRPRGGRVFDPEDPQPSGIHHRDLAKIVIEPLSLALRELATLGITHRSIRPDNLFWMDEKKRAIALGDCVTVPAAYDQPVVFEPIERAMCMRVGRGEGEPTDDYYALGVTLVSILLGHIPGGERSAVDHLESKIKEGSYASLCGSERISLSLLEPLRGLLSDDPGERWDLEKLDLWIDGRRMSPIQKKAAKKAERGFRFDGREHHNARTLAIAFSRKPLDCVRLIRDGQVELWLRRGLEDPETAGQVAALLQADAATPPEKKMPDDMLVANVCIILDPYAPIRYKSLSFMPDGFGPLLANEVHKGNGQAAAEVVVRDIPSIWFKNQLQIRPGIFSRDEKNFAQLRGFLTITEPGFGIERCLYEMNPSLPCQSPLVEKDYVLVIEDLLPALDRISKKIDSKIRPVDRHIAAFMAARFNHNIEAHLNAFAAPAPETNTLGMISLLAVVQWKTGIESLPGLASWIGGQLGPALDNYNSKTVRREIEREIPKLVRKGSLPEMYNLIDNAEARQKDNYGFELARAQYRAAEREIREIEEAGGTKIETAAKTAEQVASVMSILIALVATAAMFMKYEW